MLSYNPDWRWYLETEKYVFYPSVKIVQQDNLDNWNNVFKIIEDELHKIQV